MGVFSKKLFIKVTMLLAIAQNFNSLPTGAFKIKTNIEGGSGKICLELLDEARSTANGPAYLFTKDYSNDCKQRFFLKGAPPTNPGPYGIVKEIRELKLQLGIGFLQGQEFVQRRSPIDLTSNDNLFNFINVGGNTYKIKNVAGDSAGFLFFLSWQSLPVIRLLNYYTF